MTLADLNEHIRKVRQLSPAEREAAFEDQLSRMRRREREPIVACPEIERHTARVLCR